jgi:hypothetical protein
VPGAPEEGFAGERLTVLFGGPHQSLQSFVRAGVRPGDAVFRVRAHRKQLRLLGRMEISRMYDHDTVGERVATEDHARPLRWRPIKGACTSEVLLGPPGTPLTFDHAVPGAMLSPADLPFPARW